MQGLLELSVCRQLGCYWKGLAAASWEELECLWRQGFRALPGDMPTRRFILRPHLPPKWLHRALQIEMLSLPSIWPFPILLAFHVHSSAMLCSWPPEVHCQIAQHLPVCIRPNSAHSSTWQASLTLPVAGRYVVLQTLLLSSVLQGARKRQMVVATGLLASATLDPVWLPQSWRDP